MIAQQEPGPNETTQAEPSGTKLRRILEPFGVDARSAFPLSTSTCVERNCQRRALVGELVCPVHFGIATAEEIPDYLTDAAARGKRIVRTVLMAILLASLGFSIGATLGDAHFGWLGGLGAGLVVTAGVSRELQLHRFAAALGLVGFLVATILVVAGGLVATILALPWIVTRLL